MVGGRLAGMGHGWVLSIVWAVLNGFDLWVKCTSFAELEIHSNDRVLGIGQVTVWSSHVEYVAW
jgi:hypothetical protein